jgi:hypothetical protein
MTNLTKAHSRSIISPAAAQSAAGIDLLEFTGASTPTQMCFFIARVMAGRMGHSSEWRFPVSRKVNPVRPATNVIDLAGDSPLITITGAHHG